MVSTVWKVTNPLHTALMIIAIKVELIDTILHPTVSVIKFSFA
jgi:hypothetical protein